MRDAADYDHPAIEMVRRDLQELRSKARASGILGSKTGDALAPASGRQRSALADVVVGATGEKGKQAAGKLLAMFRRGKDDTSPTVLGTDFTESGVARVLNLMNGPRPQEGTSQKILQRLHKFLSEPVADGTETVVGLSVQRIRRASRMLQQIEKHGWAHFRAHAAKRKAAGGAANEANRVEPAPAPEPPRKRRPRA